MRAAWPASMRSAMPPSGCNGRKSGADFNCSASLGSVRMHILCGSPLALRSGRRGRWSVVATRTMQVGAVRRSVGYPFATTYRFAENSTIGVGGLAKRFSWFSSAEDVIAIARICQQEGMSILACGEGSNMVVGDEGFDGWAIRSQHQRIRAERQPRRGKVRVRVGAGCKWDRFVEWAVRHNLQGVECLSAIPGLAGAAPVQNVGAYGQEVSAVFVGAVVADLSTMSVTRLAATDCDFRYRYSAMKHQPGRFVVCSVLLSLSATEDGPVAYSELRDRLDGRTYAKLAEIRSAVIAIRRTKGMVLDLSDPDSRSAGSFFTNPVVDGAEYDALVSRVGEEDPVAVPHWPTEDGRIKLSAAWLIERAGFAKGCSIGNAAISSKHALAITNRGGATASEVAELARSIVDTVRVRLGVSLVPEVHMVGISDVPLAQ